MDDIFSFQRLPFYDSSVQDSYEYIITSFVAKQMNPSDFGSAFSFWFSGSLSAALLRMRYRLYSLSASHPRFGTIECTILDSKKEDKSYIEWTICLFRSQSERTLLSKLTLMNIVMAADKLKAVQRKRTAIRAVMETPLAKDFEFAAPADVGQLSPDAVFLGNLWSVGGDGISAKGLISGENGFDAHPWITGSGDHINSCHAVAVCSQFVHLLSRNASELRGHSEVDQLFVDKVNAHCSLAIYSSESKFVKFLELGSFVVRLGSLRMIALEGERGGDPVSGFKVPFAFQVELAIEQNDRQCVMCTVKVCPVLLSSLL